MNKKLKILLVVSLLLNGLLAGLLLGKSSPFPMRPNGGPPKFDMADMPPSLQHKLDAAMNASFERDKDLRKQIEDKRQEIADIMKAAPFDTATFKTKNDELFTLLGQAGRNMAAAVSEVAEDAPPEQRADIARMLLKGPGAGAPDALRQQPRHPDRHGHPRPENTGEGPSYMPPAEYEASPSQDNADDAPSPDHP